MVEACKPVRLAADTLNRPDRAVDLYWQFDRDFVAKTDGDAFRVTHDEIEAWGTTRAMPADHGDWAESLGGYGAG